jgi:amino acid transporter
VTTLAERAAGLAQDSPSLKRELGLLSLVAIVFFNVSGGPYGIEDAVASFGPGLTLLLLALTPVLWSLPVSLAMAELAGAMPDEGGYVTWVRRAFGPFWSFQVGWWSWIDSFVDVAVYPALFVEYVRFWAPAMGPPERWLLAVLFIVVLTTLNVLGVKPTGQAAVALSILALLPILLLVGVALAAATQVPWRPFVAPGHTAGAGLGIGLAVVMWNYSGWDTPSTCLGEAKAPERAFRRALFVALPVIAAAYLLPVGAVLATGVTDWSTWQTGSLPTLAREIAGNWLGQAVALGAVVSTAGLFLTLLLTNSRLPYVLARDGFLPAAVGGIHPRFGTPWVALVLSSLLYAAFAVFSFKELIVLNVWLYSISLLVELGAFVWLRVREPEMARPWRVRGGLPIALVVAGVPAMLALLALATAGWLNTMAGLIAALTGPAVYAGLRAARRDFRR